MKNSLLGLIIVLGFLLSSCGRSPDSQFYVLNPLSPIKNQIKCYSHLRLGINRIHVPVYMNKPQIVIHNSPQEVKLEEFHRWVDTLATNTQKVIEANLSTLLPGAVVVSEPWDANFRPNYLLQIDILEFEIDCKGSSKLSAQFFIYSNNKLIKKGSLVYRKKVEPPSIDNLVASMNVNLNQLTRDLAKAISCLKYCKPD